MTTIDDKFLNVLNTHKQLENNLQLYIKTGYKSYEVMIEDALEDIKINEDLKVYKKFEDLYLGIKTEQIENTQNVYEKTKGGQ